MLTCTYNNQTEGEIMNVQLAAADLASLETIEVLRAITAPGHVAAALAGEPDAVAAHVALADELVRRGEWSYADE